MGLDVQRIDERIRVLRAEIADIKRDGSLYVRERYHTAQDSRDHDNRMLRLKQIMDELASLRNGKREES